MPWRPILRDDVAIVARNRVSRLAAALADSDNSAASPAALCDRALVFGYLGQLETQRAKRIQALEYLNLASERVTPELPSGIINGLSCVGWTFEHRHSAVLNRTLIADDSNRGDDPLEDLDRLILSRLRRDRWSGSYDLIGGLVGIGVYFLERYPLPTAYEGLRLIVGHLESTAEESRAGITWHTPPRLLPDTERVQCPNGHYNLGVAHGVPAVVYLVSEMMAAGVETTRAERLFEGAVKWLVGQKQRTDVASCYAYWIAAGVGTTVSRVAWCYGDLGIGGVLHHVATRHGRSDLLHLARELVDRCLSRSTDNLDAAFCHGAVGIGHILNRLYQAELQNRYRDAAIHYYERSLALMTGMETAAIDGSLLEGVSGIALALLAATEDIEPEWDRRMVLSGRSRFTH